MFVTRYFLKSRNIKIPKYYKMTDYEKIFCIIDSGYVAGGGAGCRAGTLRLP